MKITLAGYNVETDQLEQVSSSPAKHLFTPEIFSAAYARISRSPKSITSLRKQAREDIVKARKSNQTIIFEMGHHSVAEHAVFNFDIIDVSRLALEEIEKSRLVSYTEKSQRYVTLAGDYLVPKEIKDSQSITRFKKIIKLQNDFYQKSLAIIRDYLFNQYPECLKNKKEKKDLENLAKEDARYILSLATLGQVGLTINARSLEHLLRRFALSPRTEVQEIRERIFSLVKTVAPSIILFAEPSQFEKHLCSDFVQIFQNSDLEKKPFGIEPVMIDHSSNGDDIILAAFLMMIKGINFLDAQTMVHLKNQKEKEKIYKNLFEHSEFFDRPPREFELADITFQAAISASCFAQLKRHRMATLIPGNYDVDLGHTIPESIQATSLEKEFLQIIEQTNDLYYQLKNRYHSAADYLLSNSHRRSVLVKMNLRELYHFIRLREDTHAQWDIRHLAEKIAMLVKKEMPHSSLFLCGKSNFFQEYEKIFNKKPKFLP